MQEKGIMDNKEKIEKRLESNREILRILGEIIEKNPEIRFCQALCGLGLPYYDAISDGVNEAEGAIDRFYEESVDTLVIVKKYLEQY